MLRDTSALQQHLGVILSGEAPITAVTPMTTGFSNDTYLIEGPDLILRLPPPRRHQAVDGQAVIGREHHQLRIDETRLERVLHQPQAQRQRLELAQAAGLLGAPLQLLAQGPLEQRVGAGGDQ